MHGGLLIKSPKWTYKNNACGGVKAAKEFL
jgi:hypothetical protein